MPADEQLERRQLFGIERGQLLAQRVFQLHFAAVDQLGAKGLVVMGVVGRDAGLPRLLAQLVVALQVVGRIVQQRAEHFLRILLDGRHQAQHRQAASAARR